MGETYETPTYTSLQVEDAFEVREYAPMLVAEVTVAGDKKTSRGDAFRILAAFIFGENVPAESIEMTAPVTQEPAKIEMTAPVTQEPASAGEAGEERWVVAFIMPSEYTMETLPKPTDERIRIRMTEPRRYAAVRFSGLHTDGNLEKNRVKLVDWMAAQDLEPIGEPVYAYYDSPFTLPALRRNEVLIPLALPQPEVSEGEVSTDRTL
ncbi:MAG: heme-binding protein [Opitutales bacterium]